MRTHNPFIPDCKCYACKPIVREIKNPILDLTSVLGQVIALQEERLRKIKCGLFACMMGEPITLPRDIAPHSILIGSYAHILYDSQSDIDLVVDPRDMHSLEPYLQTHWKEYPGKTFKSYHGNDSDVSTMQVRKFQSGRCPNYENSKLPSLDLIIPEPGETPVECFSRMPFTFLHQAVYVDASGIQQEVLYGAKRTLRSRTLTPLPTSTNAGFQKFMQKANDPTRRSPITSWAWNYEIPTPPILEHEVVYGWKVFEVFSDGTLVGGYGNRWETDTYEAVCENAYNNFPSDVAGEDSDCTCGIWSYKEKPEHYLYDAIALCILWGGVYEYTRGYRSDFARIEKLFVPSNLETQQVARMALRYPNVFIERTKYDG